MYRRIAFTSVCSVVLVAFSSMLIVAIQNRPSVDTTRERYVREWMAKQHADLQAGKQSRIYFYDSTGTDDLLLEFANEAGIKELTFELTDLTDEGVKVIAGLPNLERLTLYGGGRPIGDRGLEQLRGNETLSSLKLVNIHVTDNGLAVLQTLPNLKHLTLYREGFREKFLTDKAVIELQKLSTLTSLNVAGGWLTPSGFEALRTALPNCHVVENENWDLFGEPGK